MQYVGRAIGSVSKTWNSINPATLSGAIDVIVVEQKNGDLSCSPFHVRFGKFSLLRPSQKKVEFSVNGVKTDLPMKLGEGGEAFFVFETENKVPRDLLTSPLLSPVSSPEASPTTPPSGSPNLQEPDFLDLETTRSESPDRHSALADNNVYNDKEFSRSNVTLRSSSPSLSRDEAEERVRTIAQKLTDVNIPSKITDNGDILLDMTGYKSDQGDFKESEDAVRKILAEEFGDGIEAIRHDDDGKILRIFSREDSLGYMSDDNQTTASAPIPSTVDDGDALASPPPELQSDEERGSYHAKTLRLTSDQLKSLNLHPGCNDIQFSVNGSRAVCQARMFYWKFSQPIVISDIDGTITKSDALGHVLTMLGRDWTHLGVGKLFTDIANNGFNIMYLTARSVGQADSTRYYLKGVEQNGYKLPDGPVILSPDRTMAALRREVIMKKPEVFKMACLRDIQSLFGDRDDGTPFYAGFGNRITDALSYRSVGVPSSKIFTINTNSEVHMELLELAGYKSTYVYISDLVDHFFPPVMESNKIEETYTDVNFWREPIADLSDLESLDGDSSDRSEVTPRGRSPAKDNKSDSDKHSNHRMSESEHDDEDEDYDEDEDDEDEGDEDEDEEYDDDEDEEEYDDEEDEEEDQADEKEQILSELPMELARKG